jgi:hypothetical protein
MAKDWMERNAFWLHWLWKFLIPVALLLGSALGSYFISYFGIETKVHAAETYQTKADALQSAIVQAKTEDEFKRLLIEFRIRQVVDRKEIVKLNNGHNYSTEDYPIITGDTK